MKKILALACALCLLLACAACAESPLGHTVPDFTVSTTDGGTLTLSELLAEKQLVVLNLFASWCPPCEKEFPEMEAVYKRLSGDMEIVALSAYPGDTMEIIADYKADHALTFPMGLAGDAISFVNLTAYPTTLLIDRDGSVGYFQVGAFTDAAAFEAAATAFLGDDYETKTISLFTVYAVDQFGELVPGALVRLSAEGESQTLRTGESGSAALVMEAPVEYAAEVLEAPEGYSLAPDVEPYVDLDVGYAVVPVMKD